MDCEEPLKNPNLYVVYADSVASGYVLAEEGSTILSESMSHILSYGE